MITADTHVIIWNALKPELLSKKSINAIAKANNSDGIIVSDISLWEIAMLIHKNRVDIDADYIEFINLILNTNQYVVKSITPEIAEISTMSLPAEINLDPADRIIAATSIVYNAPLVTADRNLQKSDSIRSIW